MLCWVGPLSPTDCTKQLIRTVIFKYFFPLFFLWVVDIHLVSSSVTKGGQLRHQLQFTEGQPQLGQPLPQATQGTDPGSYASANGELVRQHSAYAGRDVVPINILLLHADSSLYPK